MKFQRILFTLFLLPALILEAQTTPPSRHPTLGFAQVNGSFVIDTDLQKTEDDSPESKRKEHEGMLLTEFIKGLQESKECRGIDISLKASKTSRFLLRVSMSGHDIHTDTQFWFWFLTREGVSLRKGSVGLGGMGFAATAKLAARDVCRTILEDLDPHRLQKPAKSGTEGKPTSVWKACGSDCK